MSSQAQLNSLDAKNYTNILGLFSEGHMQYHLFNDVDNKMGVGVQPSLLEMAQKALQIVSTNPNGFVMLIESGRIDHAHHDNKAKLALEEVAHLHTVINVLRSQIDKEDTLMIVTADHSMDMTISGYPVRECFAIFS
jgi:alkaline phosphatase